MRRRSGPSLNCGFTLSSGQKGKSGSDLEHVKDLIERVGSPRLGWCFDTCHGHAAGYMLAMDDKNALDEITRLGLWKDLRCVHVNDSKDDFDSGRDRHENIGDGNLDKDDLKAFLADKNVRKLPLILEVPGLDKKGPDAENIRRLRELAGE